MNPALLVWKPPLVLKLRSLFRGGSLMQDYNITNRIEHYHTSREFDKKKSLVFL